MMLPPPRAASLDGIPESQPDTTHVDGDDLIEDVNGIIDNRLPHAFNAGFASKISTPW